jgi:hypothetical protein
MKKNFKKKCLAWVTAVILALAAVPVASMSGVVSAAEDGTSATIDGVTYTISDGEATVTSGAGASGEVVIQNVVRIDGDDTDYKVVAIGKNAFSQNSKITSVTLGDNVTSIGMYAFMRCEGLTDVKNGSNVTSVSYEAFMYCTNLKNVEIGENITSIGAASFEYCESLTDVPFGDKVELIGGAAFDGCKALEKIVLPDSLTQVGDNTFSSCENLTDVTIGSGLTVISQWMFSGCSKLTETIIPQGFTTIGASAFANCTSLKNVNIPQSVTMIGSNAFTGCTSLEEVTIFNSTLTLSNNKDDIDKEKDAKVFDQCNNLTSIYIPCNADVAAMFGSDSGITLGEDDGYTTADGSTSGKFYRMHNIVYTVENQTISALCSVNNENLGGVTVVAPAELEYTGNAITATLSGEITGVSAPTINYVAAEGSGLTDGKPVEAGTYTACITIEGVTASVDFTITAKTPDEPDNSDPSNEAGETDNSDPSNETDEAETIVITPQIDKASPVQTASVSAPKEKLLESESFFTEEEKQELANNANLEVTLNVKSVEENAVPTEDKKEITDEMTSIKASSAVHYLDLSLMKKVGSRPATAVSNPGTDISITIDIPDDMLNSNTSVKRTYVVIRLHIEGTTREVTPLYGNFDDKTNQFTFATDRFSTYALTYIDTESATVATEPSASPNPEKPTSENPTTATSGYDDDTDLTDDAAETSSTGTLVASENKGNTSTGAAYAANTASADVGASSPKTADTANVPAMATLMALAGCMALIGVKAGHTRRR